MQTTPPVQQKPMRTVAVLFASAGIALLLHQVFFLACSGGFLFSGISAFFVILVAAVFVQS